MQCALDLGMDSAVVIHTPLMWIDKAATFALATRSAATHVDLLVEDTHTCYLGDRTRRHEWGYGCGMPGLQAAGGRICEMEGGMTSDKIETRRKLEGIMFLVLLALTHPTANWMIGNAGTKCVPTARAASGGARAAGAVGRRP